jgi:hypothetical protein
MVSWPGVARLFLDCGITHVIVVFDPSHIPRAKRSMKRIKHWAKHSPINFLGKQFLLEAELAVVTGDTLSALSKYICAISLSTDGGFSMQAALANERAGKFLLEQGDKDLAKPYFEEALLFYEKWGAPTKVQHLKNEVKGVF